MFGISYPTLIQQRPSSKHIDMSTFFSFNPVHAHCRVAPIDNVLVTCRIDVRCTKNVIEISALRYTWCNLRLCWAIIVSSGSRQTNPYVECKSHLTAKLTMPMDANGKHLNTKEYLFLGCQFVDLYRKYSPFITCSCHDYIMACTRLSHM